jgi:predicted metal-dependent phosphoesterase TrpH
MHRSLFFFLSPDIDKTGLSAENKITYPDGRNRPGRKKDFFMYNHKIETHLHTCTVSKCGHLNAKTLIPAYKEAGYEGICVTDHYNRNTVDYLKLDLSRKDGLLEQFLRGYDEMCEEGAKYGIRIYRGAELRFDECENDYLFYNWPDDLLRDMDKIMKMSIVEFSRLARETDAFLFQAHPYRKKCTPAIACYLDGLEVYNGNPRHDSHNERAREYADQFGLIALAGSDCHQTPDIACAGICTEELPANDAELVSLIRAKEFELMIPTAED